MVARSIAVGLVLLTIGLTVSAQVARADDTTKAKKYTAYDYVQDRKTLKKFKEDAAKLDSTHKYVEAAHLKAQAEALKRKMDLIRRQAHKTTTYSSSPYRSPYSNNP